MIKFAQQGTKGLLVGLGLSHENLRVLRDPLMPIVFPASEVGLGSGVFVLTVVGGEELVRQAYGSEIRCMLSLTERVLGQLKDGACPDVDMRTLGLDRDGVIALFSGPTEEAMVAALQKSGLAAPDVRMNFPTRPAPRPGAAAVSSPAQAHAPRRAGNPWGLMFSGAVLVALSGIGFSNGKSGAALLVAAGGVAVIAWAISTLRART